MAKMQVFTYDNLALYDGLLKGYVDEKDAKSLKTVAIDGNTLKFYRVSEPVGSTEPAYTITLPSADLSGLIPKITGATAGNVVVAKADGTIEDAGIKAADLATKAEVGAVKDAVDVLNGADTVEGSVAKSVKDVKDELTTEINKKADSATTIEGYGITDAYTKTEIDSKINVALTSALIYKGTVNTYEDLPTADQKVGDVYNIATADDTHNIKAGDNVAWNGTGWDVLAGTVDLSAYSTTTEVESKIATAKQDAIDTAAADATTKANTAETNAKAAVTALENGAVKTNADNIASLQGLVGEGVEAIPEESIRSLFA